MAPSLAQSFYLPKNSDGEYLPFPSSIIPDGTQCILSKEGIRLLNGMFNTGLLEGEILQRTSGSCLFDRCGLGLAGLATPDGLILCIPVDKDVFSEIRPSSVPDPSRR